MRVFVIGFMAAGKSTVSRHLARQLQWEFLDLDRRIERMSGCRLAEIFKRYGEDGFRSRETMALREACSAPRLVIATGGGAFGRTENRVLIEQYGTSVFLDPPFDLIWNRLMKSPTERPLLKGEDETRALWNSRRERYLEADLVISVPKDGEPAAVAKLVVGALMENPCAI